MKSQEVNFQNYIICMLASRAGSSKGTKKKKKKKKIIIIIDY